MFIIPQLHLQYAGLIVISGIHFLAQVNNIGTEETTLQNERISHLNLLEDIYAVMRFMMEFISNILPRIETSHLFNFLQFFFRSLSCTTSVTISYKSVFVTCT